MEALILRVFFKHYIGLVHKNLMVTVRVTVQ
jgi:hypothetical protein